MKIKPLFPDYSIGQPPCFLIEHENEYEHQIIKQVIRTYVNREKENIEFGIYSHGGSTHYTSFQFGFAKAYKRKLTFKQKIKEIWKILF